MKYAVNSIIVLLVLFVISTLSFFAQDKAAEGKDLFVEKKCNGCHSVTVAGITKKAPSTSKQGPPDLSTVGSQHAPGFIAKFITKEDTLHGKKHLIKFNGNDEELKTLSEWLENLKAPPDSMKK